MMAAMRQAFRREKDTVAPQPAAPLDAARSGKLSRRQDIWILS
jgi:hypothetical protein